MRSILPQGSHRSETYFLENSWNLDFSTILSFVNKSLPNNEFPYPLPADPYTK